MELTANKLKLLAQGSNSEVYLYGEKETGVVLKTVGCSSKQIKHLLNEYRILKKLHHPHIIYAFKYSQQVSLEASSSSESTRNVLVLENADHGNMLNLIKRKQISIPLIRNLFHQVCDAVQYLHCNYIVHRDLKLDNVLLREDNGKLSTKLADFGFAESFVREDKIVYFSSYKGTKKGYMAPEIHENLHSNRPYDGTKADIFALGVILFTMVCRKYPFEYATPNDSMYSLIASNDYEGFWKEHSKSILLLENRQYSMVQDFKQLFISMVNYDPKKRPNIEDILESQWINGKSNEFIPI